MQAERAKIGALIAQIRQERGLTQTSFAEQLGTSQSAVNRIEKGRQNLSIEMLARISDVLNKEIVKIGTEGTTFRVEGGHELKGTIETKVSKNAAVGLLFAALLNEGKTTLERIPKIEEVNRLIEVLQSIGVSVKWRDNGDVEIKPPENLELDKIDEKAAKRTRSVIMMLGPLMHLSREFNLPFAGGCKLGKRTIAPHLLALKDFGIDVKTYRGRYKVTTTPRKPGVVTMYEPSDTGTENVLMAAARTEGVTEIHFASPNYMVQDMCFFLQKLGVKIEGVGTHKLRVHGVKHIRKNVKYAPSEDPIESMAFLSIAAVTNSAITITRCPYEFIELELLKLRDMGLEYKVSEPYKAKNGKTVLVDITTKKHGELNAPTEKIHPLVYPGINADNLPFFVPIAAIARGRTLIHDWMYDNRAIYFTELNKLGANVELADPHRVYVNGPTKFKSADIVSPPALRPAMILLIAMLAAEGTSIFRNVYTISRGYEDLANRLNGIGAKITVVRDL